MFVDPARIAGQSLGERRAGARPGEDALGQMRASTDVQASGLTLFNMGGGLAGRGSTAAARPLLPARTAPSAPSSCPPPAAVRPQGSMPCPCLEPREAARICAR